MNLKVYFQMSLVYLQQEGLACAQQTGVPLGTAHEIFICWMFFLSPNQQC